VFNKEAEVKLHEALQNSMYFSIILDSSDQKEIQNVSLIMRYFNSEKIVQIKLLKLNAISEKHLKIKIKRICF